MCKIKPSNSTKRLKPQQPKRTRREILPNMPRHRVIVSCDNISLQMLRFNQTCPWRMFENLISVLELRHLRKWVRALQDQTFNGVQGISLMHTTRGNERGPIPMLVCSNAPGCNVNAIFDRVHTGRPIFGRGWKRWGARLYHRADWDLCSFWNRYHDADGEFV